MLDSWDPSLVLGRCLHYRKNTNPDTCHRIPLETDIADCLLEVRKETSRCNPQEGYQSQQQPK